MSSPSKTVDISVVIVGWNAKHYLQLCLESLQRPRPGAAWKCWWSIMPPRTAAWR